MVRKILLTAILALLCISAAGAPRYERSINDGWSFHKDRDINVETVSLPHTWNAQDAADDEPGYYRGVGWYEKAVYIDDDLTGKQVFVRFGGANQVLDLYVNGSHAGQHKGGYTSFVFDISDCVRAGGNNFRIKLDSSHDENIPPIGADFTFFDKRRTHDFAPVPTLATCPNCGATVIYHRVCPECGYYRGRQIIVKDAE